MGQKQGCIKLSRPRNHHMRTRNFSKFKILFCRVLRDSTTHFVGPSVRPSVRPSVTFLNCDRFSHYCSCPTVRDWITVYPALFHFPIALPHSSDPAWHSASLHAPSLGVCLSPGQCSRLVSRFDYCQNVPLQRFPLNCHSSKSHKDDVCSICAK